MLPLTMAMWWSVKNKPFLTTGLNDEHGENVDLLNESGLVRCSTTASMNRLAHKQIVLSDGTVIPKGANMFVSTKTGYHGRRQSAHLSSLQIDVCVRCRAAGVSCKIDSHRKWKH
jgi:hypothetical protein